MRKKIVSASLLICIVVLMVPISISPVHAKRLQRVSGEFNYEYEFIIPADTTSLPSKTIIHAIEYEEWFGDFEGTGTAVFVVIVHESGLKTVDLLSMFIGEVNDKEGGLVIRLIGAKPAGGEWFGYWEITRGTGDLENLRGGGIWGGPGYGSKADPPTHPPPDIWYKGVTYEIRPQH